MKSNKKIEDHDENEELDSPADGARRKYLYRKMVIHGKAKIPARLAMKMVGPDCAFHLYRNHQAGEQES